MVKHAKKAEDTVNYQSLSQELETVINELQRDDLDVDAALKYYKRGLELVTNLEQYLKTAENKVQELQAKFTKPGA